VLNATVSNISAISWRPVLVVEEAGVPSENHRPWTSNCSFHHLQQRVECTFYISLVFMYTTVADFLLHVHPSTVDTITLSTRITINFKWTPYKFDAIYSYETFCIYSSHIDQVHVQEWTHESLSPSNSYIVTVIDFFLRFFLPTVDMDKGFNLNLSTVPTLWSGHICMSFDSDSYGVGSRLALQITKRCTRLAAASDENYSCFSMVGGSH
jgi:hypothetical protein